MINNVQNIKVSSSINKIILILKNILQKILNFQIYCHILDQSYRALKNKSQKKNKMFLIIILHNQKSNILIYQDYQIQNNWKDLKNLVASLCQQNKQSIIKMQIRQRTIIDYICYYLGSFLKKQYLFNKLIMLLIKNYVDTILFKFLQDHFCQQILKLTSEEQQQINVTYLQEFQFKPIMLEENEQIRDNESYIKNLITFDQYLIIQQESTISILTKRVANEKLICDILRNSTTANYSGLLLDHQLVIQYINQQSIEEQQKFSDYQSENISSYLLSVFMTKQQKLKLLKGSQTYYQLI